MRTKCISNRRAFLTAAVLSSACLTTVAQDYRVLHHFAGGTNDGSAPLGSLIQFGSSFYGMTKLGGRNNIGTIFKMNTDGTDFQLLHNFVSGGNDGSTPYGSLLLSGSMLYGMAGSENDVPNKGTLFRIRVDGTDFQVMHRFAGPPGDGRWPYESLIQSGSTLYGMTVAGGSFDNSGSCWGGTVFQINTNGMGYQILHHFAGSGADGKWAPGNLVQSGSTLYGMTYGGGSGGLGTVFKVNTNGSGFQLLHSFAGGPNDGSRAHSSLLLSGSMLYGMTYGGGNSNKGTVFTMNTNGTGFQLLHHFTGGSNDGEGPYLSSFIQSGSILYGMTPLGGSGNLGIIFQINTNGTGFQVLHSFTGSDGSTPYNSLFLYGSTLYGMTSAGGSNNLGVIFALDLLPKLAISLDATNVNLSWSTNFPGFVLESAGRLTGTWASVPGVTGYLAILPVNLQTNQFFRLRN